MITTVTLNASIDKAYYIDGSVDEGTVMRVKTCINTAGGKGLNVARIIKMCGEPVLAMGLTGGFNGAYLESLLTKDGIDHQFTKVEGETRSCINILSTDNTSTEFLEPGFEVLEKDFSLFLNSLKNVMVKSSVITLSGSIPKGLCIDSYAKIISLLKEYGKRVILDTSGALLKEGLKALPTMVKPNQEEIEALLGVEIGSREDVIAGAKKIYDMGIPYVAVSLGSEGVLLVCADGVFTATPPEIEAVNTVGCGDSMVGAFAVSMERGYPVEETLKYAVAVSAANALSEKTGYFAEEDRDHIIEKVEVKKIG
ncbi:MAG: 1-phosphofructokinase [Hespellia sp.]|nr:1-phosphofructokinase [Hespellia sp.]